MSEATRDSGLIWPDFTVCASPSKLKDLPINELTLEDFKCSGKVHPVVNDFNTKHFRFHGKWLRLGVLACYYWLVDTKNAAKETMNKMQLHVLKICKHLAHASQESWYTC